MAAGSNVEDVLKTYVERSATDGMLKLTPVMKCFETANLKKYKPVLESSVWTKHQNAGKKCTVHNVSTIVIDDVAAFYVGRQKSMKDKAPMSDPDVQKAANEIRDNIAALKNAKQKEQKVDETTKRLTDTSGYTGSHKERFGADGKGKGMEGRKEMADNSGYVGNYKGQGTYGTKK